MTVCKIETYYGHGRSEDHGNAGPVQISSEPFRSQVAETDFIKATNDVGYNAVEDLQNFHANGVAHARRTVSPSSKRQDTAHAYLHPRLKDGNHPNLHALVHSQIMRILFDDQKKATGVEYR